MLADKNIRPFTKLYTLPGRKNFEYPPPEDFGKIYLPPSAAQSAAAIFLAEIRKLTLI